MLAGGAWYAKVVKKYRMQEIHRDLELVLQYDSAAEIIENAKGANEGIGDWSEKGCRQLAVQGTSSFLKPATEALQSVEALIR